MDHADPVTVNVNGEPVAAMSVQPMALPPVIGSQERWSDRRPERGRFDGVKGRTIGGVGMPRSRSPAVADRQNAYDDTRRR